MRLFIKSDLKLILFEHCFDIQLSMINTVPTNTYNVNQSITDILCYKMVCYVLRLKAKYINSSLQKIYLILRIMFIFLLNEFEKWPRG